MKSTATVSVPATSGNIGPGFDALGLALELRDVVTATVSEEPGIRVSISGFGARILPTDSKHLVARVLVEGLDALGVEVTGLDLVCENNIPQGKGLGSSAAAIVAGLALAQALVNDQIDHEWILNQATTYEGHPDNAAACIYGGLTVAWVAEGAHARSLAVLPEILPIVGVPKAELPTEKARGLLPQEVPLADAAFNAGRSSLVVVGLTRDAGVLLDATDDLLHQPYRQTAYPDSLTVVHQLRGEGIAACISGAGPSVLALVQKDSAEEAIRIIEHAGFTAMNLVVASSGIVVH